MDAYCLEGRWRQCVLIPKDGNSVCPQVRSHIDAVLWRVVVDEVKSKRSDDAITRSVHYVIVGQDLPVFRYERAQRGLHRALGTQCPVARQ